MDANRREFFPDALWLVLLIRVHWRPLAVSFSSLAFHAARINDSTRRQLRHAEQFLNRRHPPHRLAQAVFEHRAHATFAGQAEILRRAGPLDDGIVEPLVQQHQLENALAALEPGALALRTARAAPQANGQVLRRRDLELLEDQLGILDLLLALVADHPDQALGQDAQETGREQVRLDPHVHQARDGPGGVVGVQGRKNQVARERGAHHQLRRFRVARFAHQDDVRVLPEQRAQAGAEGQANVFLDLRLADEPHAVFDRVFQREGAHVRRARFAEDRVERGGLAAAGRAGHEDDAVGLVDEFAKLREHVRLEAERVQVPDLRGRIEDAQHDIFAVSGRQAGDAQVHLAAAHQHAGPAVLRHARLRHVDVGQDFEPRGHGALHRLGDEQFGVKQAIDARADAHHVFLRLEMDVAGAAVDGPGDDLAYQPDDGHVFIRHAGLLGGVFEIHRRLFGFLIEDFFDRLVNRIAP